MIPLTDHGTFLVDGEVRDSAPVSAQEARQHRHNQADADSVERDSAQNYDQGSVGFHVWPPDQPPLVRLNARILYH